MTGRAGAWTDPRGAGRRLPHEEGTIPINIPASPNDLVTLLSAFPKTTLPSSLPLFHGGAFAPGTPLSEIAHGMWFSTDSDLAKQYARYGSAGTPTFLLEVMAHRELSVIVLPNAPLTVLSKHYVPYLPRHAEIHRDLAASFKAMGVDGMAFTDPSLHAAGFTEVFLAGIQYITSVVSHDRVGAADPF